MRQLKNKKICLLLFFIILFSLESFGQDKIICNETRESAGSGSTFILFNYGKLKRIKGKAIYPDGSTVRVNVEIYKNTFNRSSDIGYYEVNQIISIENEIKTCVSDELGNFDFKGLKSGFYLLKVGNNKNDGYGPSHVLIEISQRKGKKRKLEIELAQQI